jgi:hypothetical protein
VMFAIDLRRFVHFVCPFYPMGFMCYHLAMSMKSISSLKSLSFSNGIANPSGCPGISLAYLLSHPRKSAHRTRPPANNIASSTSLATLSQQAPPVKTWAGTCRWRRGIDEDAETLTLRSLRCSHVGLAGHACERWIAGRRRCTHDCPAAIPPGFGGQKVTPKVGGPVHRLHKNIILSPNPLDKNHATRIASLPELDS